MAAFDRTLHLLTHQVTEAEGDFEMEVQVRLTGFVSRNSGESFVGGFRFGVRGELDEYRHTLVNALEWMDAGVRGDGQVILGEQESNTSLDASQWINLRLKALMNGTTASLKLVARRTWRKPKA